MLEKPCIANKATTTQGSRPQEVGYERKQHSYKGGDFCVHCGRARP